MKPAIESAARLLQKIEAFILSASILGIAALTIGNVVARNLFGASLAVAEELSQFLIIAVTFVGLSYAASRDRHIRMTAFVEQLSAAARRRWDRVVCGLTALLMLVLCVYAARYVYAVYQLGGVYSVTQLPFHAVYVAAPIGFGLAAIQYGLRSVATETSGEPTAVISPEAGRE